MVDATATRRSISLQAYRTLTRRGAAGAQDLQTPRPRGELVWIHLGRERDLLAVRDLADRLGMQRPGVHVLITLPPDNAAAAVRHDDTSAGLLRIAPDEHPRAVDTFLDHWVPDLALWVWGGLRPNLVDETARRGIPMHLVSADIRGFDGRRDLWLRELSRHLLRCFSTASTGTLASTERLIRLGMPEERITMQSPLQPTGHLLRCQSSDLDDLSSNLGGRPVWLAAQTRASEWATVLSAHRQALRSAHRLLLVIEPATPADAAGLCDEIDRQALSRGVWGDGEWPDEVTQVLVADLPDELGLWYRIATLSFLGSSLDAGHGGTDPMPAAALGTAILYGPNIGRHLDSYSRLANAGAARIVKDAASLASAVAQLIAPDQAAGMAHAGWDVVSQGANALDEVIALIQDALDSRTG